MEQTALLIQSFRGPHLFFSLFHLWPTLCGMCVGSRFPKQEWSSIYDPCREASRISSPLGCPGTSRHVNTSFFLQISRLGCGRSIQAGRAVTGAPAHASAYRWETSPRSQCPVWRGLHLFTAWGSPLALFSRRKEPPTSSGHCPQATAPGSDGRTPGTPCTPSLSDISPVPFQPAFPGWGQELCLNHPGPSFSGPGLRCWASCAVPEPKMHRAFSLLQVKVELPQAEAHAQAKPRSLFLLAQLCAGHTGDSRKEGVQRNRGSGFI